MDAQFDPPARRYREDGWTPDVQLRFIDALAWSGSVRRSALAVQRTTTGAYRLRAQPDAVVFRRAWAAALDQAYDRMREIALDRVVDGTPVPVFHKGQHIYERTVFSDRLLTFMLDHLKPAADPEALASSYRVADSAPVYALAHAALAEAAETGDEPSMPEPQRTGEAGTPVVAMTREEFLERIANARRSTD